jgi:integrase
MARHISPLSPPHDLQHTFAFQLAKVTGADAYELERRLGHRSQRYTNPPEHIAAMYVEDFLAANDTLLRNFQIWPLWL